MGGKNWEEREEDKNRIILAIVQYASHSYSSYLYLYFSRYHIDRNLWPFIAL